jgi:hypothetical protein
VQAAGCPIAAHDWFRRTTWSKEDEIEFFVRLGRSRTPFHKAQYLRIQALSLAESGSDSLLRVALSLLDRLLTEFPVRTEVASAHLQAAQCQARLGCLPEAVEQFRLSLAAQARLPNVDPGTALEFSWFIVQHQLTEMYDEALSVLATAHIAFPVQAFKAAAARAVIAEFRHDFEAAATNARAAIAAADLAESPFRYHKGLGLVGEQYRLVIERMNSLKD